ncbi:MAG: hypothetical protein IPN32_06250 [Deltaproteobacteria bacterium]|nr:hypothetical protein [Deltaproteobacteria bacterium]
MPAALMLPERIDPGCEPQPGDGPSGIGPPLSSPLSLVLGSTVGSLLPLLSAGPSVVTSVVVLGCAVVDGESSPLVCDDASSPEELESAAVALSCDEVSAHAVAKTKAVVRASGRKAVMGRGA